VSNSGNAGAAKSHDRLGSIVATLKRISIAVIGDKRTGKSKLIEALQGKEFGAMVPSVVPIAAFAPGLSVVDTSTRAEDREDLLAKVAQAQALVLLYSPDEAESLARLRTFWMPFLRSLAGTLRKPVVVASAKDDLRTDLDDELAIAALLADYEEVEGFMPVSAKERRNVTELFLFAVQAVMYTQLGGFVSGVEEEASAAMRRERQRWETEREGLEAMVSMASAEREALRAKLAAEALRGADAVKMLEDRLSQQTVSHESELSRVI
jgi:GTPase SAR1 family protein